MGKTFTLELSDIAYTGEAVGRHRGRVVFVNHALPGELVEVEPTHERRSYVRARLRSVVTSSADRITPRCQHFTHCGGCQWQHVSYPAQLAYKTRAVRNQLVHIGKINDANVLPCIASPDVYGYRNHSQFVLMDDGSFGYYLKSSRTSLPIRECPILDPVISAMIFAGGADSLTRSRISALRNSLDSPDQLREIHLRCGHNTGERHISAELISGDYIPVLGDFPLLESVTSYTYSLSAGSFFQVNTGVAALLVQKLRDVLLLNGSEHILELYSGVGFLTLPLSEWASTVTAIESSGVSVADARANTSHRSNIELIVADVRLWLQRGTGMRKWDVIVADPPRVGIDREAVTELAKLRAPRIAYLSCDPATLARDARILTDAGYRLHVAQPYDMFPQTHHIETLALFTFKPDADMR